MDDYESRSRRRIRSLLHELSELGDAWRTRVRLALTTLQALFETRIAVIVHFHQGAVSSITYLYEKMSRADLRLLDRLFTGDKSAAHLTGRQISSIRGALVVKTRRDLVSDPQWRLSALFREHLRPLGLDDCLLSKRVNARGSSERLELYRASGDPAFGPEHVRAVRYFHRRFSFTDPRLLPGPTERMPEREARALDFIVAGYPEKVIADRLGVSASLVRKLTTSLYQRFDVASRAELIAQCLDQPRAGELHRAPRSAPAALGGSPATALSPRQRDTLEALRTGASESEIAASLGLSRHTVHDYIKALYKRFGVSSRGALMTLTAGRLQEECSNVGLGGSSPRAPR